MSYFNLRLMSLLDSGRSGDLEICNETVTLKPGGGPVTNLRLVKVREMSHTVRALVDIPRSFSSICNETEVTIFPVSPGGSSNTRFLGPPSVADVKCREFLETFYKYSHHVWKPQFFYLINMPCFVVVGTGVILLSDGRCIGESIYPSSGEKSPERLIGGGIDLENLGSNMTGAEELRIEGLVAPLLSRWSNVYFHAVTESLVQDIVFRDAVDSSMLTYVSPMKLRPVERMVRQQASFPVYETNMPLIRVERLLVSSLLYQHAVMGEHFLKFALDRKLAYCNVTSSKPRMVYISRGNAVARQIYNEGELEIALENLGFEILLGETLSFPEQVSFMSAAEIIVGSHGAGLTNAAFASPNAALIELRPLNRQGESPMWGMSYRQLSSIMGFSYCAHVSLNLPDSDGWTANIEEILQIIDNIRKDRNSWKTTLAGV